MTLARELNAASWDLYLGADRTFDTGGGNIFRFRELLPLADLNEHDLRKVEELCRTEIRRRRREELIEWREEDDTSRIGDP